MKLLLIYYLDPEEIPEDIAEEIQELIRKSQNIMHHYRFGYEISGGTIMFYRDKETSLHAEGR